ncbi:protein FAR-RED IMPAIRED RESPONSE 1-like [Juglans microcarpa x Juglans regia]|uniref:protein FAR-RED IMPAIRED RESPONSE 1-like n=1 Tax=Juglans microcarpa x Juglans regia TaxID=2249226 RepID=UPI001B7F7254|nr:protein FAR-RED IMPAIRED RESPONSE 1-like [Juglans microcarpa x Juglans regia]
MGKGEEYSSPQIPSSSNPPTADIPSSNRYFVDYTSPDYYGPLPAWAMPFPPYPDGGQDPRNIQVNVSDPTPLMTTYSATSERVDIEEPPKCRETDIPCTSERVEESKEDRLNSEETEDGIAGTPHLSEEVGGDPIQEPSSRMEFNTFEELMVYYKQYGKKSGFGVMIRRTDKGDDGTVRYVTLGCARGGKARNRTLNVARPRPTGKTECKAKINALKVDGNFRLTTVNNTHNHDLSPNKARFFRCNREVSDSVKRVLDINDMAGIRMNKSFGSLVVGPGGFENLSFLEKDCRNYIDKARHLRLGKGGAGALQEYFCRMQYKNPGFFALMDLDDEGRLRNVFWADPRSRAAYQYFGDVVTFDTTYLTNRYGMPFAPFVGVNHHGQSILLGAGLISSEDTETFVWLFQTWLKCMDGIAPKAIITDQDRAMKNAIAIVFPESRHRLCLWHILKKVPEKLSSYASYKSGMKNALMKCVYDTHTIDEFEKSWDELIDTYHLHDNVWLKSLYTEREYWVPAFLKDCFWAGMSTTQRSESMNAFFDGYVHAKTNLKEFVDQFDSALKKKIESKNNADFHSFSVTIPCISRSPIEKRFQELYTNAKFREVQMQLTGIIDLDPELLKRDGAVKTYLVEDEVRVEEFSKLVTFSVDFNEEDADVKCSCGLFQMRGILCRHILAVFKCNGRKSLPEKYILDRWRKDIKRRYTLIDSSYDVGDQRPDACRYSRCDT